MDRIKLRGTKRHCQNAGCALPYYDLNRTQIQCPNCGADYVIQEPVKQPARFPRRPGSAHARWPVAAADVPTLVAVTTDEIETSPEAELEETPGTGPLLELDIQDAADGGIIEPGSDRALEE